MKKNNSFTTESDVKNVENKQSEQQKVREGQPDSSILSDKAPVVKNDKAFKEQDEFIDRNNNRKSEG